MVTLPFSNVTRRANAVYGWAPLSVAWHVLNENLSFWGGATFYWKKENCRPGNFCSNLARQYLVVIMNTNISNCSKHTEINYGTPTRFYSHPVQSTFSRYVRNRTKRSLYYTPSVRYGGFILIKQRPDRITYYNLFRERATIRTPSRTSRRPIGNENRCGTHPGEHVLANWILFVREMKRTRRRWFSNRRQ